MSTLIDAGAKVGRSFSLGSFVPTVALVGWLALLAISAPSYGTKVSWPKDALPSLTWTETGLFGAAFFVTALAVHPLIFASTQLLEGYWGNSWLGVMAAGVVSSTRRLQVHALERVVVSRSELLETVAEQARLSAKSDISPDDWADGWIDSSDARDLHHLLVSRDSAARALDRYPESPSRVLPTKLGNALRREEDRLGKQYGLDAMTVAGHLAFVAPPEQTSHLDDARGQLDTSVRLCSAGMIAFTVTAGWLLPSGQSLLVALAPLAFAYVSYQGAVAAAQEYMHTYGVILDLNRFALYNRLHIPLPDDVASEVAQNGRLVEMLGGAQVNQRYEHKDTT